MISPNCNQIFWKFDLVLIWLETGQIDLIKQNNTISMNKTLKYVGLLTV